MLLEKAPKVEPLCGSNVRHDLFPVTERCERG